VTELISALLRGDIFETRIAAMGSHDGISFNLPKLGFGADVTRQTPYLSV